MPWPDTRVYLFTLIYTCDVEKWPAWTLTSMLSGTTDPQRMPYLLRFVDLSSALNTISPMTLIRTLNNLGFSTTLCNWILDFLTLRKRSDHISYNVQHSETGTGAFNPNPNPGKLCTEEGKYTPPVYISGIVIKHI